MKINYLFPNRYKKIGWLLLVPSAIIGLATLITGYEPEYLTMKVPAVFANELMGERQFFAMIENNVLNEVLGILVIIGSVFVAFSKEDQEDEYISKIRLESLVWAVYVNYGILFLSFLFIYDFAFLWVMIFNMFTILLFFIIRFNWKLLKLKKSMRYEE